VREEGGHCHICDPAKTTFASRVREHTGRGTTSAAGTKRSGIPPVTHCAIPGNAVGPVLQHRPDGTPPKALDRARRASDVINIINYTGKDNLPRPRPPTVALVRERADGGPAESRVREALALAAGVAVDWLAYFLRRWGDQWFAMNDTEAYWRGWQITKTHAGLGRRYRDIRFDTLAACAQCAGAGEWAEAPCGPCLGTGRITLGEVS
jgi:hypothetical protein